MFHIVEIHTSTDDQGNQYTSIRRWDNHGKLGYTGNQCGNGRIYRTGNVQRIDATLRAMGYHYMSTGQYGKLVI